MPEVVPVVDDGLGNSGYLGDLGDGRALAVHQSRDLRGLRRQLAGHGLRVGFISDTHLHADFLSAARQLAAVDGIQMLASAAGNREFPHTGLRDGDEVDLGGLRLRALATSGHTLEHLSFLLLVGDSPVGVFTGGSLLVGAAAFATWLGWLADASVAIVVVRNPDQVAVLLGGPEDWAERTGGRLETGG